MKESIRKRESKKSNRVCRENEEDTGGSRNRSSIKKGISTKDLVFKEWLAKKLTKRYVRSYMIEEIISVDVIELKLLELMRIYLVVNISRVVRYGELVKG